MYNTLIVDDEPKLREVIKIKLSKYCPLISVVGEAADVDEAHEKIKSLNPQLILLDISMPGASGFELLNRVDKINFEIIFITGFNEYALDALKVSAVDYLLKPVKTEELVSAIDKAIKRMDLRDSLTKYEVLKNNLQSQRNQNTTIAIPGTNSYDFIKISEIVRCEGWNKYTKVHLHNGKTIISSNNIGVFREILEVYEFHTTHKSHLINTKQIMRYNKDGVITMKDGSEVPLARRRKEDFINEVMKSIVVK